MNYRLSVSGKVVTKIDGFESQDDRYAIAEAHNRLKSGEFIFLENATLERRDSNDTLTTVANYSFRNKEWIPMRPLTR